MTDVLDRIVASVRQYLGATKAPPDLERRALEAATRQATGRRSLAAALREPGVRVIAECKRRSPSAGLLRDPFDPVALAAAYQGGGAAAVSVVTEPDFFGGDEGWIAPVRSAVTLPVLRKDFIVSERQLFETVLLGADAVLLIARLFDSRRLVDLSELALGLRLEVLLEVHDESELERALATTAPLIGVNARNLATFEVDVEGAAKLAARLPSDRIAVLESGIADTATISGLAGRGLRRFLIGEYLVRAPDSKAAVAKLVACRPDGRAT